MKMIFLIISLVCSSLVFAEMSLEQKLGQLFILPASPQRSDERHLHDLRDAIDVWHVGGFLLQAGTMSETRNLVERLQTISSTPLLIAADAEWGLTMRVIDATRYPRNMTLGAVRDIDLIEQMGRGVAGEMKALGIHLNLAPVVDVNSNPKNPVIHTRSFGDSPKEVSKRGVAMAKGLQSGGVFATAKHFPGHGDTSVDSHCALPVTENYELLPFKALIDHEVACVMTAHILIPSVDDLPVTFSKKWVSEILRNQLHFRGLVVTDALNMKGIAQNVDPGEIVVRAFEAGHDLLLYGAHAYSDIDEILGNILPLAVHALKSAVISGRISMEEVDARVQKILAMKKELPTKGSSFPTPSALPRRLYQEALTEIGKLPRLCRAIVVELGRDRQFAARIEKEGIERGGDLVLVFGGSDQETARDAIQRVKPQAIVFFGTPYLLQLIPEGIPVLLAYEETPEAWDAAAKAFAGNVPCRGQLPISLKTEVLHFATRL